MPILDVELVETPTGEGSMAGVAQRLADTAGRALGAPDGRTWVRLRILPRANYAESGGPIADDLAPVFVDVLKAARPADDAIRDEAVRLAESVAAVLDRPVRNVHVFYQESAKGRVAFGGRLV